MNGAFDKLKLAGKAARRNSVRDLLGGFAIPAMAGVGTLAVVAVLAGLQCGGLDRCFVANAEMAAVEPAEAAEETPVAEEERLVPDEIVAAKPAAPPVDPRAQQIAALIGGSFEAIRADDQGWLAGAYAPPEEDTVRAVEEGDGPGPVVASAAAPKVVAVPPKAVPVSGAAAVAAINELEQPVKPLARPRPLAVSAFAEEPQQTPARVKAAAEQQLAAVAAKAAPAKAQPEKEAEPEKVAAVEDSNLRTVAGSGANVRSGPGKSNKTLFALAGGEKVKVGENQRGWLKITDDQGRTGWIYKTYLK